MKALLPKTMAPPFASYSHGVMAGRLIVTSGQLGLDADGVTPASVGAQAELCFSNIKAILAEAGADLSHVLRFNAFVLQREHMAQYMIVRDRLVADLATKPASTLLIVSGFSRPEFLVEVEAIALLPN